MHCKITSSQLHWRDLIQCSDEELAQYDIAALNLACAVGLPEAENLNIQNCLRTLDRWAEQINCITQNCSWFHDKPEKYGYSFSLFQVHVMFSMLSLHYGFHYNPACTKISETAEVRFRADELFIHGLLQGKGGTCSSMPVLFIAIGRRLGYPLKIVKTVSHYFVRWDSPEERFNVEVSSLKGFSCYADSHYRNWPFSVSPQKEVEQCLLTNLTPRREIAAFMFERAFVWHAVGAYKEATDSFIWAKVLEPENLLYGAMVLEEMRRWADYLDTILPQPHPLIGHVASSQRRYPPEVIPLTIEQKMMCFEAIQAVLEAPQHQHWWELLRQGSVENWPKNIPRRISVHLS